MSSIPRTCMTLQIGKVTPDGFEDRLSQTLDQKAGTLRWSDLPEPVVGDQMHIQRKMLDIPRQDNLLNILAQNEHTYVTLLPPSSLNSQSNLPIASNQNTLKSRTSGGAKAQSILSSATSATQATPYRDLLPSPPITSPLPGTAYRRYRT